MAVLGIRKEDENKKFERRTPLIPQHIAALLTDQPDIECRVEPSTGATYERAYNDCEFEAAGAQVGPIADADVILGIKEVPICDLLPGRVYMNFSHTYKGQPYNMATLRKYRNLGCTLIDYELIVEDVDDDVYVIDRFRREVYFGRFAGYAGTVNSLHALGQRLLAEGSNTPFAHIKQAKDYHGPHGDFGHFDLALQAVQTAGEQIQRDGLPDAITPLIVGVTGRGNAAQGTLHVLEHLPVINIKPEELAAFAPPADEARHHLYCVQFQREHRTQPQFEGYAQTLTLLLNCIKWKPQQGRLITRPFLQTLYTAEDAPRLRVIGDISCDPNGAVEISRPTYPDAPCYTYDPARDDVSHPWNEGQFDATCQMGIHPHGPVVMAVANLPTEFPRDASAAFSTMLRPFVPPLLAADFAQPFEVLDVSRQLKRAIIVHQGRLTPDFEERLAMKVEHEVLLLGAGLMSPAVINYLVGKGYRVTVADVNPTQAAERIASYPPDRVQAVELQIGTDDSDLIAALQQADVAISLLPSSLHTTVARHCINTRTHLVTASYTSDDMRQLHDAAQQAGVILLNEAGLDPGIDHLSACQIIDCVHADGGEIKRFTSYCGGLPTPEDANNPLHFKASWSPAGIVSAANRPAQFFQDGAHHTRQPVDLFSAPETFTYDEGAMEGYPNGDSTPYREIYGLAEAETVIRGTLRYAGWSSIILALHHLGWFSERPAAEVAQQTAPDAAAEAVINWLGLRDDPTGLAREHLLNCFTHQPDLAYHAGENDLVVMRHTFDITYPDGRAEQRVSSLTLRGGELSAMAQTVGLTAAICTRLILERKYTRTGVQIPVTSDLYQPVLAELAEHGICFTETVTD